MQPVQDNPSYRFTHPGWRGKARLGFRYGRELVGDAPVFLPLVMAATPLGFTRRLTPDTQLVIEGFPRSGNTFALHALILAERQAGREVVIKSHVHTPSQVKAAAKHGIPILYVIREPVGAVASLIVAAAHVPVAHGLHEYTHHHEELLPYRDRMVIGEFREITSDYASVIDRVNERFGTSFARFDQSDANVKKVFSEIELDHQRVNKGTETAVPRPSEARQPEKEWLVEQITSPKHRKDLEAAQRVYETFTAGIDLPG